MSAQEWHYECYSILLHAEQYWTTYTSTNYIDGKYSRNDKMILQNDHHKRQ